MSRLTGDRNLQNSQSQQNNSHNQQIQQVVRIPTTPQQQLLSHPQNSSIIGSTNNDGQRASINTINPIQHNSIYYSTPPSTSSASATSSTTNVGVNPACANISTPTTHHSSDTTSPIAKKRLKLEVDSSSTSATEDLAAIKKRILERKHERLKSIKDRCADHVAELYFLQTGGSMMDFPGWRKKPATPQFVQFKKSYQLDQTVCDDADGSLRALNQQNQPEGAEIKIPGVGSTPIAISKQLPAAVAQLSQKGQIPGKPQGGRHGMIFGQLSSSSSSIGNSPQKTPLVPGGTPLVLSEQKRLNSLGSIVGSTNGSITPSSLNQNASTSSALSHQYNTNDQFSVKAKEEVYVLQRVQELKRGGLWTGARLPKLVEPQRQKCHWDFLLEEMQWLAADFAAEKKWKKSAAKKCSKAIQKYFQDKEMAAQRAEKAQEQNLRRIAAFIAKEVKTFWLNIKKIVEEKQQKRLEAKRQVAFNEHLKLMVDQTEQFSKQVAKGMNKKTSVTTSLNSSRISSPTPRHASDDEWMEDEDSDDDEETIAKEEKEVPESSTKDEIDALQKESEMDLDDLLKDEFLLDYLKNRDKIVVPESDSEHSNSEKEFGKRKKTEQNSDHRHSSKAESEMSIDESKTKSNEELDSDDESMATEMSSDEEMEAESDEEESDVESVDEVKPTEDVGLKNLLEDQQTSREDNCDNANAVLDSVAAIAQSIQPKGNTLTSTDVVTPIPFLLKHTLREYQHIGLDWLVTMHDRQLNGILADEMGLGKTIQTIALLAHLACVRQNWGPHLIIVPSSVMLNWEMEFKKWCPGFKILTYYGSQKERKQKRIGWTKPNAFHVCITSYKLVIQDHQSFRRKKWKYLILDEAQNIKNFKSQRWQLLLNFVTEQRLLLTGTPLQNNMMELWSLMHFLMPSFFESHRTFEELFSKPMTGMVEGNVEYNENIIMKLHKVLRPFLLRRLKCEVEKQMPKKYEHVVMCRLSKRQRFLYDDFMSRTKTKETLASGNMLSVINVLMQLRKVCNHPNLFEVRPTVSPFRMEQIDLKVPSMLTNIFQYDPLRDIDLVAMNFVLLHFETCLTGFVAHRMKMLATPKKLIEEIDSSPELPPAIPKGKCKMFIRVKPEVNRQLMKWKEIPNTRVSVGTSPVIQRDGTRVEKSNNNQVVPMDVDSDKPVSTPIQIPSTSGLRQQKPTHQLIQSAAGQLYLVNNKQSILTKSGQMVIVNPQPASNVTQPFATACIDAVRNATQAAAIAQPDEKDKEPSEFLLEDVEESKRNYRLHLLQLLHKSNLKKLMANPLYGEDCIQNLSIIFKKASEIEKLSFNARSSVICNNLRFREDWSLSKAIKSIDDRAEELKEIFEKFVLFVPAVTSELPSMSVTHMHPSLKNEEVVRQQIIQQELAPKATLLHPIASAMTTQFPDPRLIQYDCGKLQSLDILLRKLKSETHRVLIFTQMTKMLDVLEAFLNYHGHIYLRLDGTTKVEQRQLLMERFNEDKRIFAFILSTRSGGVGINLTGADTVIFYDSDWNPTCDAQAQDRCHRIGQTRDVHIYRLISERTIEENILKKANQKRLLGDLAIEGGNFTEAFFRDTAIQDLFNVDQSADATARLADVVDRDKERRERLTQSLENKEVDKTTLGAFEQALAQAEDDQDVQAAKTATAEIAQDLDEFDENIPITEEKESEITKQEKEFLETINLLNPIEKYAIKFVEDSGADLAAERLKAVEEEIENRKREWEEKQAAQRRQEELERQRTEREDNEILTYSREDAMNKVNITSKRKSQLLGKRKHENNAKNLNNSQQGKKTNGREIVVQNGSAKKSPNKSHVKIESPTRRSFRNRNNDDLPQPPPTKQPVKLDLSSKKNQQQRKTMRSTSIMSGKSKTRSASESTSRSSGNRQTMTPDDSNSECSLDVMIDSNDVNDSDSNSNQKSRGHFDTTSNDDDTLMNDDSTMTDETIVENEDRNKSLLKSIDKKNTSSPRTRSRGTVQVNLWTLDESPIEPRQKAKKSISENHKEDNDSRMKHALKECEVQVVRLSDKVEKKELNESKPSPKMKPPNSKKFNVKNNQTLDSWLKSSPKPQEDSEEKKEISTRARRSISVVNKTH